MISQMHLMITISLMLVEKVLLQMVMAQFMKFVSSGIQTIKKMPMYQTKK